MLQPQQTTVQIEGSALEAALVSALQPLYGEIAELRQAQAISNTVLENLVDRVELQESTLMQLLTQLQDLLDDGHSSTMERQLQRLLSQLLTTSSSLSTTAASLQQVIDRGSQEP
jgi:vacuolar-type H+-ATPase subunit E/Vma4